MTAGELFGVVRDLVRAPGADPIAHSRTVKDELTQRGIIWDNSRGGRSGGFLEQADLAVKKDGRLQRWKHTGSGELGWSISERHNALEYGQAEAWAEANGWVKSVKY